MFIAIALGLVGLVAVLHHKSAKALDDSGQTGASNGVTIDKESSKVETVAPLTANGLIGRYGATPTPSPMTGAGRASSSSLITQIDTMKRYSITGGGGNAFISQMHTKGTVLNPLPQGLGTQSKQLLTKDTVVKPGVKF